MTRHDAKIWLKRRHMKLPEDLKTSIVSMPIFQNPSFLVGLNNSE